MTRRPPPPSSETPSSETPSSEPTGFAEDRSDTVRLSAAELRRQLEEHGFKNPTEGDVTPAAPEDPAAQLKRLADD